jgi:hypothetical protein
MDDLLPNVNWLNDLPNTSYTVTLMVSEEAPLMLSLKWLLVGLGYALTSNNPKAGGTEAIAASWLSAGGIITDVFAVGTAFITATAARDTQPVTVFFANTLYVPAAKPLKIPVTVFT